jgi:hypothetical protein
MNVFAFPPKESFKINVNLESLYGICVFACLLLKAFITNPRELNDLFILFAYFNLSPVANVFFCFYDPAKSTKCSFEYLI